MKRLLMMFLVVSSIRCDAIETKNIYRTIKRTVERSTKQSIGYAVAGLVAVVGSAFVIKKKFYNQGYEPLNQNPSNEPLSQLLLSGNGRVLYEVQYEQAFRGLANKAGSGLHDNASYNGIMFFINRGFNPNYQCEGQTLLQLACKSGNSEVAQQLIGKGATVDDTCFINALQLDRAGLYRNHGGKAYRDWHNDNRRPLLELVLNKGANINYKDAQGTALDRANGIDPQLIGFLVNKGINTMPNYNK